MSILLFLILLTIYLIDKKLTRVFRLKRISYVLTTPDLWYIDLNSKLPSTIKEKSFIFDDTLGNGKLTYIKAQNGLWAQQMNFNLNNTLKLFRTPTKTNAFFTLGFYLSDSEVIQHTGNKRYTLGLKNINAALSSSTTPTSIELKSNKSFNIFNIVFSKTWLTDNVLIDRPELKPIFNEEKPIHLSENLDYTYKAILDEIDFENNNKLTSTSSVVQIVNHFFENLSLNKA